MAFRLKAIYGPPLLLLLFAIALLPADCHATLGNGGLISAHHAIGRRDFHPNIARPAQTKPKFTAGPWKKAHATFYDGDQFHYGGACNYKDVFSLGYGSDTAALSNVLWKNAQGCGSCYEIKCVDNPQWCKPGQPTVTVTATDNCPPNYYLANDNGGWCNEPREHFDLSRSAFGQLAEYVAGITPVEYRRVPCKKQGGIRFTITGNPWFYEVLVWNVAGAGDVVGVQVKGDDKVKWTEMEHFWGATWKTCAHLAGESLTFRVRASDGRSSTSWRVAPRNWQFGQTFEGKNFR